MAKEENKSGKEVEVRKGSVVIKEGKSENFSDKGAQKRSEQTFVNTSDASKRGKE